MPSVLDQPQFVSLKDMEHRGPRQQRSHGGQASQFTSLRSWPGLIPLTSPQIQLHSSSASSSAWGDSIKELSSMLGSSSHQIDSVRLSSFLQKFQHILQNLAKNKTHKQIRQHREINQSYLCQIETLQSKPNNPLSKCYFGNNNSHWHHLSRLLDQHQHTHLQCSLFTHFNSVPQKETFQNNSKRTQSIWNHDITLLYCIV